MNKPLLLLAALALAGPVAAVPAKQDPRYAAEPVFLPERFFIGHTEGEATLKVLFKSAQPVRVHSIGRVDPDGTLVLDQRVEEGKKPPRDRTWRLRAAGAGRYVGTLSDAAGPVTADVQGNLMHLRYTDKDGLAFEQWMYLQPGGRVVLNRLSVHKWGVAVASLQETIRKRD